MKNDFVCWGFLGIFVAGLAGCVSVNGQADGAFVYAQWNIGHFAMGHASRTTVSPERSAARAAEYRAMIRRLDADVIGVSEFSSDFDTAKTPSRTAVFADYPHLVSGPENNYQCNALMTRRWSFVTNSVHDYRERHQKCYWLDTVVRMDGEDVHFVQTHLDWDVNGRCVSNRRRQIRELVAAFRDTPRVVISADFNVSYDSEWEPFRKAGFELAVGGRFGAFATAAFPSNRDDPARTDGLDNIIVKGFAIDEVEILDSELKLSDHGIVRATLRPVDVPEPPPPSVTQEVAVQRGTAPSLLPAGAWRLVWHDEFDGTRLDDSKWGYRTNFWGRRAKWFAGPEDGAVTVTNGTCRLRPVRTKDGRLVSPQLQTGGLVWDDVGLSTNKKSFWPFPPRMEHRFTHRYGYYECRCRLQRRPGWWSAFWMQAPGNGATLDPETDGVEQDIMESFSPGNVMTHAFHAGGYGAEYHGFNAHHQTANFETQPAAKLDTETFHRFGLLWEEDGYTVYIDGKPSGMKVGNHADEVVSQVAEFILLTTELKGFRANGCTGSADPEAAAAVAAGDDFEVDYVRVFDKVR